MSKMNVTGPNFTEDQIRAEEKRRAALERANVHETESASKHQAAPELAAGDPDGSAGEEKARASAPKGRRSAQPADTA